MTPYFRAFLAVLTAVLLGVTLAFGLSGCAATPAKADAPFVSVVVFVDHCDGKLVEAAFVRKDGTIVEVEDPAEVHKLDAHIPPEHGLTAPVSIGPCELHL